MEMHAQYSVLLFSIKKIGKVTNSLSKSQPQKVIKEPVSPRFPKVAMKQ